MGAAAGQDLKSVLEGSNGLRSSQGTIKSLLKRSSMDADAASSSRGGNASNHDSLSNTLRAKRDKIDKKSLDIIG